MRKVSGEVNQRMTEDFEEMVDEVFSWLEGEGIEVIAKFTDEQKGDLVAYHHTLGRNIRNTFELWKLEWEPNIIDGVDHSPNHPDEISMRVIEAVWERANRAYR